MGLFICDTGHNLKSGGIYMQTIYTTSCRLGVRDNIIDLNAYRRQLEQSMQQPEEEIEVEPLLWAREERQKEEQPLSFRRTRRAAGVSAWIMDVCASAGVLAMTAAFTMAIL